ncbi:uncharacterized protein N7482_000145 [Penicillium canariense]|uniref:Exonuclease domain-containing protein n=1 Tax=Penicillium canariense TaxID=189055 RepID=A0A9W9ICT0_9EURO|nr:uncharacterized protein N7482_000145 [Penicillium canariense]KAJ5174268.1 hypothetical protein N7482_000145 [Penicillium canariense]
MDPTAIQADMGLITIVDTPEEWADMQGLVLSEFQMRQQGIRVTDFAYHELVKMRRFRLSYKAHKRRKTAAHRKEEEREMQLMQAQSKRDDEYLARMKNALEKKMMEDQEFALLVAQRDVFTADTKVEEAPGLNGVVLPDGLSILSPSSSATPKPDAAVDYSEFSTADTGNHHKPGPDGTILHYRTLIAWNEATNVTTYHEVPITEEEYQRHLKKQQKQHQQKQAFCHGHPGHLRLGRYTCCGKGIGNFGCHQSPRHGATQAVWELQEDFQLHETPQDCKHARRCIALDCEMGLTDMGEPELIRVSAVDYFSGETLLDALVFPKVKMWHLNTQYSGVSWPMLYDAHLKDNTIAGRDVARQLLWNFVGPETIVITHGGREDFLALRWLHPNVIDTLECEDRRFDPEHPRTLKNLAKVHLGREIQRTGRGHDSLEDARACRDLLHWYVQNLPAKMKVKVVPPVYVHVSWEDIVAKGVPSTGIEWNPS